MAKSFTASRIQHKVAKTFRSSTFQVRIQVINKNTIFLCTYQGNKSLKEKQVDAQISFAAMQKSQTPTPNLPPKRTLRQVEEILKKLPTTSQP
ncbi:hypothetical protein CDAR_55301 [Caerostris darwini]|uniref:Uncharacterized protein n=1 Tax=Caerostris darwini TaxID=1538125 RepID=A0AAV4R4I3_9ARAC|nr:hypothetical protein CDAR_55301 [Caerostris darwini]